MKKPNIDKVLAAMQRKGYATFTQKPYDINLIGVRAAERRADKFDDYIICHFLNDKGKFETIIAEATTDPGKHWLQTPFSENVRIYGTAILKEGQYRSVYALGGHGIGRWRHEALVQVRAMDVYRDNNWDEFLDMDNAKVSRGIYGINLHAANLWATEEFVGKYSAGCQVVRKYEDLKAILNACRRQVASGLGNSFSYTLLNESDIK